MSFSNLRGALDAELLNLFIKHKELTLDEILTKTITAQDIHDSLTRLIAQKYVERATWAQKYVLVSSVRSRKSSRKSSKVG